MILSLANESANMRNHVLTQNALRGRSYWKNQHNYPNLYNMRVWTVSTSSWCRKNVCVNVKPLSLNWAASRSPEYTLTNPWFYLIRLHSCEFNTTFRHLIEVNANPSSDQTRFSVIACEVPAQSCPRVTFLGPDSTRQNVDPTRPAIADQKSYPTRPTTRSFSHMYSLYLNNNLLIS